MENRYHLGELAAALLVAVWLFALEVDEPGYTVGRLLLVCGVGVVLVGVGLFADLDGERRVGLLVQLAGASWLVERLLGAFHDQLLIAIGGLLGGAWTAFLLHAVLAFPGGRLSSRLDRVTVAATYVVVIGLQVLLMLTLPSFEPRGNTGRNPLHVVGSAQFADDLSRFIDRATLVVIVAYAVVVARRLVTATRAARRAYGFVWLGGLVLSVNGAILTIAGLGVVPFNVAYGLWLEIVAGIVPIAMALCLIAARLAQDRLVALVADLEAVGPGATLRNALRRSLADPSLEIVYHRAGSGGWVTDGGIPAEAPDPEADQASTPIVRGGRTIAALVHDPALLRNPERLRAAIGATALAIDNEQLKAELRAQVLEVRASRSRIVEAADRERRRVERNLHDGAQQRLVGLALVLRLAGGRVEGDQALAGLLAEAARELDDALAELRELARGIHPAIVTEAGLGALESLAERPGVPIELSVDVPGRLPEHVEVGAYYVVAEALANANKHAGAEHVTVGATVRDDVLLLTVSDDGRGGAAAAPGSGLEGLGDRVSSLAGRLAIDSPVGGGTTLTAEIPLRVPSGDH